ncbi:hypothetical protein SUGI_0262880 [Cryptomeria japonica]|nr:hypothetical protein SUGI_0262880 [Cryptomeria japonica]
MCMIPTGSLSTHLMLVHSQEESLYFVPSEGVARNYREEIMTMKLGRRRMLGLRHLPGSSPPKCKSKCGNCRPCKSVLVPINPKMTVHAEYYPQVWRCRCNGKLYNP